MSNNTIQTFSRTATFLRFPLIIGVIFIHGDILDLYVQGKCLSCQQPDWYFLLVRLFWKVLPGIAVPCFYIISGYFFFLNSKQFGKKEYSNKLKSRISTLLVPYLLWIFLYDVYCIILSQPFIQSHFPAAVHSNWTISYFLSTFWAAEGSTCPGLFVLWYIRDLMIMMLMSPIIFWLINKINIWVPIILLVTFIIFDSFITFHFPWGNPIYPLTFFTIGAYCGLNRNNLLEVTPIMRYAIPILWIFTAIIAACYPNHIYFKNISVSIGSFAALIIAERLSKKHVVSRVSIWPNCSFFLYCLHPFISGHIQKIAFILIPTSNPILMMGISSCSLIFSAILMVLIFQVAKKNIPNLTALFVGGRL
jgi:fucose 4-O-acetylase-like acetyltransferase